MANEPAAKEKAPAAAEARPAAAPAMFSPVAYVVILMLLVADAGIVWYLTKNWTSAPEAGPPISSEFTTVSLGEVSRQLAADDLGIRREKVSLQIMLVLNPAYGDMEALSAEVDKRKLQLKAVVYRDLFLPKNAEEFRKPNFVKGFGLEVKQYLNNLLGRSAEGQDIIAEVIFPEIELPVQR